MARSGGEWLETPAFQCSVGVMAHNEAANIGHALASILEQRPELGQIREVVVVASGCTDATVPIVADMARKDPRVRLIVQERREGKASAINVFLGEAQSPVLLLVSADVVLKDGTVDHLLGHLRDPRVGMIGAHPIPVNGEGTFLGHAVHLLWQLHDRVAREVPKLGEVVAFRNVVPNIPRDTPVDEISIQALINQLGYSLVYEPRAIVYNRGPATVGDFLRQRRRICAGHLKIEQQYGYVASTMSVWRILRALLATDALADLETAWWTLGTICLEALARGLGGYDYLRRRPNHVWQIAATTKRYIAEEASSLAQQSVLVFHIVGFHQHELELGARAAQLLAQHVTYQIQRALEPAGGGFVSLKRGGTTIVLLPVAREEAERRAQLLLQASESAPVRVNGHRDAIQIKLACGIIEFLQTGTTSAVSVPAATATA